MLSSYEACDAGLLLPVTTAGQDLRLRRRRHVERRPEPLLRGSRMIRSGLTSLLGLALVVLLISACGGGSSTTASSTGSPSTTSTGSDAAVGQGPPETSPPHSGPLPGHPKIGPTAGEGSAGARRHGGSAPPRARSRTGGPGDASSPSSSHARAGAGGSPERPERQDGGAARARGRAATPTSRRHTQAAPRKLESKAGAAAPFLVAQGDNSIPTYGTEASGSQLSAAEAALAAYLGARAGGDWAGACESMAIQVQKQVEALAGGEGEGCVDTYARLSAGVSAGERADPLVGGLAALRIEGETAFALFYGPGSQQYMMPLRSEGGGWKVTQIEPVPWPVGSGG